MENVPFIFIKIRNKILKIEREICQSQRQNWFHIKFWCKTFIYLFEVDFFMSFMFHWYFSELLLIMFSFTEIQLTKSNRKNRDCYRTFWRNAIKDLVFCRKNLDFVMGAWWWWWTWKIWQSTLYTFYRGWKMDIDYIIWALFIKIIRKCVWW